MTTISSSTTTRKPTATKSDRPSAPPSFAPTAPRPSVGAPSFGPRPFLAVRPARKELAALTERDPALGAWMRRLEPFPGFPARDHPRQRTHYDALASAIVHQQLSTKAAATIWRRACALTPGPHFPRAQELLRLPHDRLRAAGLSRNKVEALLDLAAKIERGELALERVARWKDERVVEHLVQVRGIGVWSAQMFLLFRLGRLDVLAPGDLGVQEGVRLLDGLAERPSPATVEERAECWRPLRSVACWTMWRLVDHARRERAAAEVPSSAPGAEGARSPGAERARSTGRR